MKIINLIKSFSFLTFFILPGLSWGLTFPLPQHGSDIVGSVHYVTIKPWQNFHSVARLYDIGYDALVAANPGVDPVQRVFWQKIAIPSEFVLPPGKHKGIVINLAEMRLFYYPPKQDDVVTFPVAVGEKGWATPTAKTYVYQKINHPTWYAPKSVIKELAAKGIDIPNEIPPGPKDPLGHYALRLALPGYLIHGTNVPTSIGTRASSGCIRLYPEDIKELFSLVATHTKVDIIDCPYQVGEKHGSIYLSAVKPLDIEGKEVGGGNPEKIVTTKLTNYKSQGLAINWQKVFQIARQAKGIPELIGTVSDPDQQKS